jgi:hypothetical protein
LVPAGGAVAAEASNNRDQPQVEAWTGAEAFQRVWSIYAGTTYAPFGNVRKNGFRVRAVAGYGAYSYASPRWTGAGVETLRFHGEVSFADLLAGYHQQLGPLTIKILGGVTAAYRDVDDPEAEAGAETGGKVALETWWNVTDRAWTSVDLSWTTLDDVYGARARAGWRLTPDWSLGIEGGAAGNRDYDAARVGGFVRYEWESGEISFSAGMAGDGPGSGQVDLDGPYATINLLGRF